MFFMFGSANRDEACFAEPDRFDITRDTQKSIAFGAGPHYCAGAFASRAMVADVALPSVFARLKGLRLDEREPVRIGGWAFRGLLNLPVTWDADASPTPPNMMARAMIASSRCDQFDGAQHEGKLQRPRGAAAPRRMRPARYQAANIRSAPSAAMKTTCEQQENLPDRHSSIAPAAPAIQPTVARLQCARLAAISIACGSNRPSRRRHDAVRSRAGVAVNNRIRWNAQCIARYQR